MHFSEEQTKAITKVKGPVMVIAGPGSGKTTVVTRRIKFLIENEKVNPAGILVITFTKAAATEMEKRFKILVNNRYYPVRFGTFHSVFYWIIRTAYGSDSFMVVSEIEKRNIISDIMRTMSLEYDNKDDIVSSLISEISLVKCDMLDIVNYYSKDLPADTFREIYIKLDKELTRLRKIDFDDMMIMCYELLKQRTDILDKCQQMFEYILVDEFQDSNRLQYELLKMLSYPQNNLFVVGDDDQSVYGFRGARPEIMQQFIKDYKGTETVILGENYRSDKNIVNAASIVIGKNNKRFKKQFKNMNNADGNVSVIYTKDVAEQNELIIKDIRGNYEKGIPYEQQAVIFRTNIQPRRLVYKLNEYNIPYSLKDSLPSIFESIVVRDVLDYFRIAMGDNSRGTFLRIMNKPVRYISRDKLTDDPVNYDKLRFDYRDKDYVVEKLDKYFVDIKMLTKMRPFAALNFVRKSIGYDDYLSKYCEQHQIDSEELYDILDELSSIIKDMSSFGDVFDYIDEYDTILSKQKQKKTNDGVPLMTMHSCKGLEFDTVSIIDAVEGVSPHKKSKSSFEIEEERRMFYVAMTRAKHKLNIYVPHLISGKTKETSRFVIDIQQNKGRKR